MKTKRAVDATIALWAHARCSFQFGVAVSIILFNTSPALADHSPARWDWAYPHDPASALFFHYFNPNYLGVDCGVTGGYGTFGNRWNPGASMIGSQVGWRIADPVALGVFSQLNVFGSRSSSLVAFGPVALLRFLRLEGWTFEGRLGLAYRGYDRAPAESGLTLGGAASYQFALGRQWGIGPHLGFRWLNNGGRTGDQQILADVGLRIGYR